MVPRAKSSGTLIVRFPLTRFPPLRILCGVSASQINPRPIYKSEPPVRDPQYLKFLRKLPCIVCFSSRTVESAHFGDRGMGQRSSDYDALPLCVKCHRMGPKSYHVLGGRRFIEVHGLNVKAHQERLQKFYREEVAA